MRGLITKSTRDILSPMVLKFILKLTISSMLIATALVWLLWGSLTSFVVSYLSWIPWEWLQTSGATIINLLIVYILFIITVSLLTSLFSDKLLIKLAQKHYPNAKVIGEARVSTSIILSLKTTAIFALLFVLAIPLLFIPILGQLIMLYLWSILIKEPTIYDVSSLFMFEKKYYKKKSKKATAIAMIASLFNYIPLLNVFAPLYAQILFLHHIFNDREVS